MKKLNQMVRFVSIVLAAGVFAMGAMPDAAAQQLPAAASALMELPGVGITEVHEEHAHYGLMASSQDDPNVIVDPEVYSYLTWRPTSFSRGGRSTAVAGTPDAQFAFFAGYTGGGVWKSADAGLTWENISDGYFNVGSIGDIKVAPSDPIVIWVGTGSGCPRGNISTGDGIYRSTDGGRTWAHVWNPGFVQVPEMVVDPFDPDHLYLSLIHI